MNVEAFLQTLPEDRRTITTTLRECILLHDRNVVEVVSVMMGQQMLMYNSPEGIFKYGLANPKSHFSFHSMLLYCRPELRERMQKELKNVKFQQGCVNVTKPSEFPIAIMEEFLREMAAMPYPPPEFRDRMLKNEEKRKAASTAPKEIPAKKGSSIHKTSGAKTSKKS